MAIKKAEAAVKKVLRVASMNPDNFVSGGLMDDFDGVITKARFAPWDYDGKIDHHVLAVALSITPSEDSGAQPFVQHYSAGDLNLFVPTMDGENPVDLDNGSGEELEGIYAMPIGKAENLRNSTNWAHFMEALVAAGFATSDITPSLEFLEGLNCHFNRVPQKKRSGIQVTTTQADGTAKRTNDVLVITKISGKEEVEAAPVAKVATKTAAKPATPAAAASSAVEDAMTSAIVEALAAADGTLPKSKLVSIALKAITGTDRARAIKLANDIAWLSASDAWAFDADSGTLALA